PAYVGKSQCNSGFLVAALRAEGLFRVDIEHKGMSRLAGDLDAWESAARTAEPPLVDGRPVTAKLHPEPKESRFRPKQATSEAAAIDATNATDAEGVRGPILRKVRRMKQPKGDAAPEPDGNEPSAADSAVADGAPTEQSDGAETAVA
ncbi:MAG: hypothetical protein QG656_1934, partial [Candidatus Hydrogenedentes bacterium]|nr:hypothetical protein [Candidatus Hydrogenedentota bacterium]